MVSRVTLIAADALAGDAAQWLAETGLDAEADAAIATIDRAIDAHRIAAADAGVPPVRREDCLVVRVGTGVGDQDADGRWTTAVVVPQPRAAPGDRAAVLRPQERLGAILGGRDVALACELLTLRARADADAARWREATLQVRVALEAALAELAPWSGQGDLDQRLAELHDLRASVGQAANTALAGGLDATQIAAVELVLTRIEAALRARTHLELP